MTTKEDIKKALRDELTRQAQDNRHDSPYFDCDGSDHWNIDGWVNVSELVNAIAKATHIST